MSRAPFVTAILLATSIGTGTTAGQSQPAAATPPYAGRLERAYALLGKNLLIIRSASAPALTGAGFDEDPSFFYFTGAARLLGGFLILDGSTRRAELFVPPPQPGMLKLIAPEQFELGALSAGALHVDRLSDWTAFAPYIDSRLAADPHVTILLDAGGFAGAVAGTLGTPMDSMATLANPYQLWAEMVRRRWPQADVRFDARILATLRAVKDSSELAVMRRVAATSAAALLAGMGQFSPGRRQRDVEAAVIAACLRVGGDGPSFWPWAMTGPNAVFPKPFTAFADPHNLDRVMRAGELARLDVGCEVDHYAGDVGRTIPVSGTYKAGQAEVVDLLVAAYRAGLAEIRDGTPVSGVIRASLAEVARRRQTLHTDLAREAAAVITRPGGAPYWELHSVGLEASEQLLDTLRAGMVIDYEPIFSVADQGFYMEDMILVTPHGYEVLTKGLPNSAAEIERAMRRAR